MRKIIFIIQCILLSTVAHSQTIITMSRLPDTGQTSSYTSTFGEDNDYSINIPVFLDHHDGTITDTISGLMWQSVDGGEMTFENAILYCDTLTLGGFSNWRLPTAQEAFSILNLQNNNPAINTSFFPNTNAEYWWTSELQANDGNKIWVTNAGGGIGNHPKNETLSAGGTKRFHIRAVRDVVDPPTIPNHFTDNEDGTITDHLTNLMWEKLPSSSTYTWEQAISSAENLSLADYSDWRLPNIKELQSLNDESAFQPSVTMPFFQNLGVAKYWSATSLPNQTAKAWYWDTAFGITTYDLKVNSNHLLCVRNITTTTGAFELNRSQILVYPNPFSSKIRIKNSSGKETFEVIDGVGRVLYSGKSLEQQDFSSLQNGIYFLKIIDNTTSIIKIIKGL